MSDIFGLGARGESLAWGYLKKQGYEILEKNFRTKLGEIDVIASKRRTLVFIEVKTRRNHNFGLPEEAIDWKKRRKMVRIAELYLQSKRWENKEARFDILSITWNGKEEPAFNLLENAFGVEA